jgi:SPP1 family predicted phage head-tail adaptor
MARVSVGQMRHRVQVQKPATTEDATGQQLAGWADLGRAVRAKVEQLGGRELYQARQAVSLATVRVTAYYRSDVADPVEGGARLRLVWLTNGNRVLNIESVRRPDDDPAVLELDCVETGAVA